MRLPDRLGGTNDNAETQRARSWRRDNAGGANNYAAQILLALRGSASRGA